MRPGKERAASPVADDEDATQVTTQENRWRAGVNRQSQPDASLHQRAAGLASGAKREASAMHSDERSAKRLADQRRRRREHRERKQDSAAPVSFDTALEQVATDAALGDEILRQDFII